MEILSVRYMQNSMKFGIYVMHQQDHLLFLSTTPLHSLQVWEEWLQELQGSKQISFAKHNEWFQTKSRPHIAGLCSANQGLSRHLVRDVRT